MSAAYVAGWSRGLLAGGRVARVVVVGDGPIPPRTICQIYVNDWTWAGIGDSMQRSVYVRARALLMCGYASDADALVAPYRDGTLAVAPWAVNWPEG